MDSEKNLSRWLLKGLRLTSLRVTKEQVPRTIDKSAVWQTRSQYIFNKKPIISTAENVCSAVLVREFGGNINSPEERSSSRRETTKAIARIGNETQE